MKYPVKPLSPDDFKSFWQQVQDYGLSILRAALLSDLYHRAMLAKAEAGQGSEDTGRTDEEWIAAKAKELGVDL